MSEDNYEPRKDSSSETAYIRILQRIGDEARTQGGKKSVAYQALDDFENLLRKKFRDDTGEDPLIIKMAEDKIKTREINKKYAGYIARLREVYNMSIALANEEKIPKGQEEKFTQFRVSNSIESIRENIQTGSN